MKAAASMTNTKRRAPDLEWVQMYRQGIPSPKIAAGAGAAESTVRYHLHLAAQADPGLWDEHKAAVGAVTRNSAAGQRNLTDVVAFYEAEGRLPTTGGKTARERALGVWLHRRRNDAAAGTLSPAYRETLDVIPGWDVASTRKADDQARWGRRLAELLEYRAAGNDWPRHKKPESEQERALGVWVHVQRISRREGTLTPDRDEQLDTVVSRLARRQGTQRRPASP
jgi:hypothetical protein